MSARIKGAALQLSIGSPATDYWADCTSVVLDNEEADADIVTFEDAQTPGGARTYFIDLAAIQSTDPDSLWTYIWTQAGVEVAFVYAPHGNETPAPDKPHFTGTVKIGPRPAIGGEAGATNTYTFETRWDVVGVPVLDNGMTPA